MLLSTVLAVPLIPLLILGLSFEDRLEGLLAGELSFTVRFGLIVLLLALDVFLPVPSSMVSTYGGGVMGTAPATAASWLGMTAGAALGFGLARRYGRPFARRLGGEEDLERTQALARRFGPMALVVTRALPILAEACVLLAGAAGMTWRKFLPPVAAGNLVVSVVYAAAGEYFRGRDALPVAVVLSGTIPLLAALVARRLLPVDGKADSR